MKKYVVAAMGLLLVLTLGACRQAPDDGWLTGYVEADLFYVSAPASGWIRELDVSEGEAVEAGQVLYRFDHDLQQAALDASQAEANAAQASLADLSQGARPEEIKVIEAQLAEAEAGLRYARTERSRWQSLGKKGVATPEEVLKAETNYATAAAAAETVRANLAVARLGGREAAIAAATAQYDAAQAAVRQAQWQLGQRQVPANQGGRVEEIFQRRGEYVTSGTPLLALLPENAMKIRFFVPEAEVGKLAQGQVVTVRSDSQAAAFEAQISFIAREAEFTPPVIYSASTRDKLLFLVEARPTEPASLRPGLPVDVKLP